MFFGFFFCLFFYFLFPFFWLLLHFSLNMNVPECKPPSVRKRRSWNMNRLYICSFIFIFFLFFLSWTKRKKKCTENKINLGCVSKTGNPATALKSVQISFGFANVGRSVGSPTVTPSPSLHAAAANTHMKFDLILCDTASLCVCLHRDFLLLELLYLFLWRDTEDVRGTWIIHCFFYYFYYYDYLKADTSHPAVALTMRPKGRKLLSATEM